MGPRLILALMAALAAASCRSTPAPPSPGTGNGQPQTISGNERLGWDQPSTLADLAAVQFAVYVDGNRSPMTETSCGTTAGANGFPCSGRLPPMSPGSHTLELAAFVVEGGSVLESPRSSSLRVVVSTGTAIARGEEGRQATPGAPAAGPPGGVRQQSIVTGDGTRLRLEMLPGELRNPVGLAADRSGIIVVAERGGRVLWARDGNGAQPVLEEGGEVAVEGGELIAVALDPDFGRNGLVFLVETAPSRAGAVFRIARFRQAGGRLAERAIILDGVPAAGARPAASLAFGPDAKLYAAFDTGGSQGSAGDLASFNGKVLRLNPDGATPRDQAGGSPVHAYPFGSPRGMAWHRRSGVLWVADESEGAGARLAAVVEARPGRALVQPIAALPAGTEVSALTMYDETQAPALRGLLAAGGRNGGIWRLRIDPLDPRRIGGAERLLEGGGVTALATAPGGAVYFCTPDRLGRLVPEER